MNSYEKITQKLTALTEGVPYAIANLANAAALLWQEIPELNWVGFYKLEAEGLILGPFQGKPACIRIPEGQGVCGAAVARAQVMLVPDVHQFPGHIACDADSRSEVVIPIWVNWKIWGVLDLDSPITGRFSPEDARGLMLCGEAVADMLAANSAGHS